VRGIGGLWEPRGMRGFGLRGASEGERHMWVAEVRGIRGVKRDER